MTAYCKFSTGQEGEVLGYDHPVLRFVSPIAFSPGKPMTFRLVSAHGELDMQGKSIGSKRRTDNRFDVRVRVVNLRRTERELLESLLID